MTPADIVRLKNLLPTSLGSAEIRQRIAADILRRAVFSARMASASYLAKIREVCIEISEGRISQADARARLLSVLEQMGHSQQDPGGLLNPASQRRLDLIIDTQRQMAASVALLSEETEATVEMTPAWRLERMGNPDHPRLDWPARWQAAGEACGWQGACKDDFVALKGSPIWQEIGNGAGGFRDTLGNPFPPFAFSSTMTWVPVGRDECAALGLDPDGGKAAKATLSPSEREIVDAAKRFGFSMGDYE